MRDNVKWAPVGWLLLALMLIFSQPTSASAVERHAWWKSDVQSGQAAQINHADSVTPGCTVANLPTVRLVDKPQHGTFWVAETMGYPKFKEDNQRFRCNSIKIKMLGIYYKSNVGFSGKDMVRYGVISPGGNYTVYTIFINVRPH